MNCDYKDASKSLNSLADYLLNLSAEEFSLLSFTLAFILAPTLNITQQNAIGNFFILFGQVLVTFNSQNNYLNNNNRDN